MFRVGHGFDSHAFIENRPLILGGVTIPFEKGLKGHSDADVLLHAVCDALLGAAALGDIGQHFSDQDPSFANRDSRYFLRTIMTMLSERQYQVNNIDVTIIAERPKLLAYRDQMVKNIAEDVKINLDQVSIKAKTNEKMGHLGRGEGIAAHAVALITRVDFSQSSTL